MMKLLSIVVLVVSFTLTLAFHSSLDCTFDAKKSFCGWKREWFGMRRAGWRSGREIPNHQLRDHTTGKGKFAHFRSRSRPAGFRSSIRSPSTTLDSGTCFVFWRAVGGVSQSFPEGNSLLRVYVVRKGEKIEPSTPIWSNGRKTRNGEFEKVTLSIDDKKDIAQNVPVEFVLEVIRGGSKLGFVAIDDITLEPCVTLPKKDDESIAISDEAKMKMKDVQKNIFQMMLPARRPEIKVLDLEKVLAGAAVAPSVSDGVINPIPVISANEERPTQRAIQIRPRRRKKGKKRRNRGRNNRRQKGRKGRRRSKNRKNRIKTNGRKSHRFGNVLIEEKHRSPLTVNSAVPSLASQPQTCDFIEYTRKLHSCLRSFFSMLRKQPKTCRTRYAALESCIRTAALTCVPSGDLDPVRVEEIIIGTLRNNFKTEEVYCKEEGAFVFPEFSVAKLPIQCGPRYFIKLSECSGSFSSMFRLQHGNPKLCKEYYQANECQRRSTAEECNFDPETMLLYGLNLQYQFAHNPFCLHVPFISWWPAN